MKRIDSLCHILKQLQTPKEKIPVLYELAALHWQLPQEPTYLKELLDMSYQADTIPVAYKTLNSLSRYYYNQTFMSPERPDYKDSLLYWVGQVDTLAARRKECPDALFYVNDLVCQYYLWTGNYELAINKTIIQLNLAEKQHHEYGQMVTYQGLGLIYQMMNRDSDAMVSFREGLVIINRIKENDPAQIIRYLSDMLPSSLRLNYFDESESLLKQFSDLLLGLEKANREKGERFMAREYRWMYNYFYAELYIRQDKLDQARSYLDQAALFAIADDNSTIQYRYHHTQAFYYMKTRQYEKALAAIDNASQIELTQEILKMKIDALRKSGQAEKAILLYSELLAMNKEAEDEAFVRQLKQLRTLNDLDNRENQSRDLLLNNQKIARKQYQVRLASAISFMLLIIIYLLFRLYQRTRRLKNDLLSERSLLIESGKQLRKAKEEAELANQKKTAFLASISHEVRTPLNAIVGFSDLLTDDSFIQERAEFSALINKNSDLLTTLVNNILDLARLESSQDFLQRDPCDLVACCRKVIAAIERYVAPGVQLLFTPSVDSFTLQTDSLRLQQLLNNLVSNAAKFTTAGSITLAFETDREQQQLQISVTDTGCGIPADKQSHIFERFEKLDEFAQGTGLGLPLCHVIAQRLKGSLFLDSSYTNGARFVFIHPLT